MKIPTLSITQVKTEPSLRTKTPELCPAIVMTTRQNLKIQEWTTKSGVCSSKASSMQCFKTDSLGAKRGDMTISKPELLP